MTYKPRPWPAKALQAKNEAEARFDEIINAGADAKRAIKAGDLALATATITIIQQAAQLGRLALENAPSPEG